ncbi:MAG: asparagine synthase (glutamine-hydrolyzing) [Desulfobacterales bacterium]|nr:asparagine synthase (glutamine-hydrolyzing) [Desulfobacterales bacterium]
MCGIAGVIGYGKPDLPQMVKAMGEPIPHRGPDGQGYFHDSDHGVGFAHRRLSILDVSQAGAQPMASHDGLQIISYNGEVYNFLEIRSRLEQLGHRFKTGTDTEVILAAYREWGRDCLKHFNGMWAFALYDKTRNQVFLSRDRLGIKPLYYYISPDNCFYFASEVKSILAVLDTPPEMDISRLDAYMGYGYVPGSSSLFKGMERLLPGHAMVVDVDSGRAESWSYWDFEFDGSRDMGLDYYVEQGRELLNSAIDLRLRSDVPLGVFLSGGLDSSAVVGLLAPRLEKPLKTFSVAYDLGKGFNETPYARQVAKLFHTDHHEFFVTPEAFQDFIPDYVKYMDEPVTESAAISLYFISKLARDHVTVVLSGEGSDEIFAGYDFYRYMAAINRYHALVGGNLAGAMSRISRRLFNPGSKIRKYLALGALPLEHRYKGISTYDGEVKDRLYRRDFKAQLGELNRDAGDFEAALFQRNSSAHSLNRMLYFDTKTWLVDDLLIKADRMSMAASLELRVPFLDYRMVEFAANLPVKYKIHRGSNKFLLKKMMAGILPENIIHRKKMGFPTPLKLMFQNQLADYSRAVLTDSSAWIRNYFNGDGVENILAEHLGGKRDNHRIIWQLLVLETWCRTWLKSPAR